MRHREIVGLFTATCPLEIVILVIGTPLESHSAFRRHDVIHAREMPGKALTVPGTGRGRHFAHQSAAQTTLRNH